MKKIITAGLSFAMAASMLAGCSRKPAENSDSGDKRVLKFDSFSGGNGEKVFTKLAKAFEKANPDVDVQLRFEKELPDVLKKSKESKPDGLLIQSQPNSTHGAVVKLMDNARNSGITSISVVEG